MFLTDIFVLRHFHFDQNFGGTKNKKKEVYLYLFGKKESVEVIDFENEDKDYHSPIPNLIGSRDDLVDAQSCGTKNVRYKIIFQNSTRRFFCDVNVFVLKSYD